MLIRSLVDYVFGYDIFISYRQRDAKEYATKLGAKLTKLNYNYFLDTRELPVGEELSKGLARALRRAQALVVNNP